MARLFNTGDRYRLPSGRQVEVMGFLQGDRVWCRYCDRKITRNGLYEMSFVPHWLWKYGVKQ